jgi:hypothetical protein
MRNVMSSEVETSRDETNTHLSGVLRPRSAPLRMTPRLAAAILFAFGSFSGAAAQETPSATPSATPVESASPSISAEQSAAETPSPTPAQTPSASPGRNVRISFVPPPLEGTISLGIYDKSGKLVRVLHQQANLSGFTIGADALVTQWDGKGGDGTDLPPGKYRAHGYLVGQLKVENLGDAAGSSVPATQDSGTKVKLMPNPLANDKRSTIDLAVGYDSSGCYLKTADGLPLWKINGSPNLSRAMLSKAGDRSVEIWQEDGGGIHRLRISNVQKMMAFDCGEFELK